LQIDKTTTTTKMLHSSCCWKMFGADMWTDGFRKGLTLAYKNIVLLKTQLS